MYKIVFEIAVLPKLPNSRSQKSFWGLHNEKKNWTNYIALATIGKRPDSPLKKSEITITRCSSRICDLDNLYGSLKAPLDALVRLGMIIDDSPLAVSLFAKWKKTTATESKLIFEIKEITDSNA